MREGAFQDLSHNRVRDLRPKMLVGVLLSIVPATTAFLAQPLAAGSGHAAALVQRRAIAPAMLDIDSSYLLGGGALFVGLGGGIGLIALTENAGKRNEEADNAQPCVVCKGERVVKCPVCDGTGESRARWATLWPL